MKFRLTVVRVQKEKKQEYPTAWLFSVLRSEQIRIQFWTESGGTSYGKLNADQIRNVLIPLATPKERRSAAKNVDTWIETAKEYSDAWSQIGVKDDLRPILNSPLIGLFDDDESKV